MTDFCVHIEIQRYGIVHERIVWEGKQGVNIYPTVSYIYNMFCKITGVCYTMC